ncbi:MAG: Trk system potassium transporter TrkA [Roseburia sp.]|nr:Trk system potassium transporter TrkA [Roseburia sp.]
MKIIIAGDGKVGATLVRQLSAEDYDLTLVDVNPNRLDSSSERFDILAVEGNCASMEVLKQAGVETADLLIAATSADEINLLCCLTAHVLNPKLHTIARIRNPEYIGQVYKMRHAFALSMTVNPERQAAVEIERLLKYPGFLKRETFAKGRMELVELKVMPGSKLGNVTLNDLDSVVKCQILVCVVVREGKAVTPDGNFVLREGDHIFVTASIENLTMLLKNLGIITHKAKRIIICGGGRVSIYLAKILEKSKITVQIIEKDRAKCELLAGLLPNACIVEGDASDEQLLESEGIADCDALITMTGLDELNMIVSLYGSQCGVPQVITKLGRTNSNGILDSLEIGSIISPKELCCNTIVRYVRAVKKQAGAALAVHTIADGQAEAVEFVVDDSTMHCNEPLKNLRIKPNVRIAGIMRSLVPELPNGDSYFQKGDTVIIITSGRVIYQINDIFE